MVELGRNEPCHCGSGKKYKKCHLLQDEEAERKSLAKAAFAPKPDAGAASAKEKDESKRPPAASAGSTGWLKKTMGKIGLSRSTSPRKSPGGK